MTLNPLVWLERAARDAFLRGINQALAILTAPPPPDAGPVVLELPEPQTAAEKRKGK